MAQVLTGIMPQWLLILITNVMHGSMLQFFMKVLLTGNVLQMFSQLIPGTKFRLVMYLNSMELHSLFRVLIRVKGQLKTGTAGEAVITFVSLLILHSIPNLLSRIFPSVTYAMQKFF